MIPQLDIRRGAPIDFATLARAVTLRTLTRSSYSIANVGQLARAELCAVQPMRLTCPVTFLTEPSGWTPRLS